MTDDAMTLRLVITGEDATANLLRNIQAELKRTEKLAGNITKAFARPVAIKAFDGIDKAATKFDKMATKVQAATRAVEQFTAAANRLPKGLDLDVGLAGANGSSGSSRRGDDFAQAARNWRTISGIRTRTAAAERRDADRADRDNRRRERDAAKADRDRFTMRMRWRRIEERERNKADREVRQHQRETDRVRRQRHGTAHRAVHSFRHAASTIGGERNFFGSPAFLVMSSLTTAILGLKESIESARKVDDATVRLKMFGGISDADAAGMRQQALKDSLNLGMGAEHVINVQSEALRAGVPADIAKMLPGLVSKAAGAMGESVETLSDNLSEALQQGVAMGQIRNADDARRFLNVDAGMSNYGGNSPLKMDEFLASGGLGHGRELGLNLTDTLSLASAFDAMGARTGQFSSRFMGNLAEVVPNLKDRWMKAIRSGEFDEKTMALRNAPESLGYGNVDAMSGAFNTAEGTIDFFARAAKKLSTKKRKLLMERLGFGQQGSAIATEIGESPEKALSFIKRGRELDQQKDSADYISEKWRQWQTSLSFMLQQIEAGFEVIKAEIGDVFKDDVIAPFRDFWVSFTGSLLDGSLRRKFHADLVGFVNGLGFTDVVDMLTRLRASVGTFDLGAFLKGFGEGLRVVGDDMMTALHALGLLTDGAGAEGLGKLLAEISGVALVAHLLGPVVGLIAAITALGQAGAAVAAFSGLTTSIKALVALPLAEAATGLAALVGPIAALVGLAGLANKKGMLQAPDSLSMEGFLRFLDPGLADRVYGRKDAPTDGALKPQKQAFVGDDQAGLLKKMSLSMDASATGRATVATSAAVEGLRLSAERTEGLLQLASFGPDSVRPRFLPRSADDASSDMGGYGQPGSTRRYFDLPESNGALPGGHKLSGEGSNGPFTPGPGSDAGTSYRSKGGKGMTEAGKARVGSWMQFFMKDMGLGRDKAAAMVGMMQGESGKNLDPTINRWDVNGPSIGTAQWHDIAGRGGRASNLMAFARSIGKDWHDVRTQQLFWKHEAETTYGRVWKRILAAPDGAAALKEGVIGFENPRDHAGEIVKRMPNYRGILQGGDFATTPSASDLASSVPMSSRKATRGSAAPPTPMSQHNEIHVHGITSPEAVGAAVQRHIGSTLGQRTHDVDFDT